MARPVSAKGAKRAASKDEREALKGTGKRATTGDSFQNFTLNLGQGTNNALSQSTYGFNPITRVRTLLEWIHRGSWLGGMAIDIIADDMTKNGIEITGDLAPEDIADIEAEATRLNVWGALNDNIRWSRLYGGSIAVMLIDGQDIATPLRLETIDRNQFKGLLVLDRWMVEPSLENLITELGPDLGLPKFYRITEFASALRGSKVHYSRCLRLEGIRLPYWQRVMENLWGISEFERIYDRMVAFDSATTGAAQSVYKSYLRVLKVTDLKEIVAVGGQMMTGLAKYVDLMAKFQSIEGVTLIDGKDDFAGHTNTTFTGMSDIILQFAQQISGALQIPLVRLLGQSPAGLNSSGDSDLRTYYDGIKKRQEAIRNQIAVVYRALSASCGKKLPKDFNFTFRSLWEPTEKEKSEIAEANTRSILAVEEAGLISPKTALQELREVGRRTNVFSSITDEQIDDSSDELPPSPLEMGGNGEDLPQALAGELKPRAEEK